MAEISLVMHRNVFGDAERSLFADEIDEAGDVDDADDIDNVPFWTVFRGVTLAPCVDPIILPVTPIISLLRCRDDEAVADDDDDDNTDADGNAEFLIFFDSFAMAGPSLK